MVPDEEPRAEASEQTQTTPARGHRRSRRGGRRHSRRRGPRPQGPPPGDKPESADTPEAPATEAPAEGSYESGYESEQHEPERHEPRPEPKLAGVTGAIDQVTRIIDELKQVLNEMEEVLETLELAERQKIDDEREIETLQRALRQLHRPGQGGGQQRR